MELLIEAGIMKERRVANLLKEANEILWMVVTSIKPSRR
jgi:hypothetical protein